MKLSHPYIQLRNKVLLLLTLRSILIWGGVMGLYHGLYFIINLSERLPVTIERIFPYGYILGVVLGLLWTGGKLYRLMKNFPRFLEEQFELDFKWFNALDQFHRPTAIPSGVAEAIFSGIGWGLIWDRLTSKSGWNLVTPEGIGVGGWLLYPILFLALPSQHSRFMDNLWTLWNYQEPYLAMEYPEYVLENQSFRLTFYGDYREGVFKEGGQEWKLKSGESLVITNVINSFSLEYRLDMGRIFKIGQIPVQVIHPPQVIAQVFTIQPPYERKPYVLEGTYTHITDIGSQIRLLLSYQDDQSLVAHELKAVVPGSDLPSTVIPVVSFPSEHQVMVDLTLKQETSLGVRVQNRYGQWSEENIFTFNIRKNQPPSVTITEPEPFIRMDHPQTLPVGFLAKDDRALRDITLRYRVISSSDDQKDGVMHNRPLTSPTTLWVSNFNLPLNNLNAPPGSRIRYYLRIRDREGELGYSATNEVRINTAAEIYTQSLEGGEYLREELNDRREDFNNLERDYEKLKILSETKKLDNQDIKNFQENVKEFSQKMQEDIANIEELEKDNFEDKQIISKNFRDKLLELKKSLEELDKDYLQKMNQGFQSILNQVNEEVNPDEINQFLQGLDLKEMENRVEQTLNYLENLKQMQKIDALEQLSQNLYLRYKDLESYIIADLVTPEQVHQEANSIQAGLEFIKKEFTEISEELPQTPRIQTLKKNILRELTAEKLSQFGELSQKSKDDDFLKQRSDNLDQLRRNLARLNNQNQNLNHAELLALINIQIFSLNQKIEWLEKLGKGEEYDLPALEENKQSDLITQFLSKHRSLLYNFREQVFLLSSAATLELDFMQHYDKAIDTMETIQQEISPDQQQPDKKAQLNLKKNLTTVKDTTSLLSRELIFLKNILSKMQKDQQQNMGLSRAMEMQRNFNRRIQEMLQRGNLTEREKQYLKNMALEQSLLRALMEEATQQGNQSGEFGQQGEGEGGEGENGSGSQGSSSGKGQGEGEGGEGENGSGSQGSSSGKGQGEGEGEEGENGSGSQGSSPGEGGGQGGEEDRASDPQQSDANSPEGKANKKRQEIINRMKQLERELLKDNPDLAKIQELQQIIEDNLFRETQGLQSREQEDSEERLAEKESENYQRDGGDNNSIYQPGEIKKGERISVDQLKNSRFDAPPDFRDRIQRFLELNSIR